MAKKPSKLGIEAQTILSELQDTRQNLSPLGLLVAVVLFVALVYGGLYLAQRFLGKPAVSPVPAGQLPTDPFFVTLSPTGTKQVPVVIAWPGEGGLGDLFSCSTVPTPM